MSASSFAGPETPAGAATVLLSVDTCSSQEVLFANDVIEMFLVLNHDHRYRSCHNDVSPSRSLSGSCGWMVEMMMVDLDDGKCRGRIEGREAERAGGQADDRIQSAQAGTDGGSRRVLRRVGKV